MANLLNKEGEELLLKAARMITDLVDDEKLEPDDAVEKTAHKLKLSAEMIRRASEAYNTGRTRFQQETSLNILDKMAEFPLANSDKVIARVYPASPEPPAKKATAARLEVVDPIYNTRPHGLAWDEKIARDQVLATPLVKAAAAPVVERTSTVNEKYAAFHQQRQHVAHLKSQLGRTKEAFLMKMAELTDYFRQPARDRLSLATVTDNVSIKYGSQAEMVMNYVAQHTYLDREKDAAVRSVRDWRVNESDMPYSSLKEALTISGEVSALERSIKTASAELDRLNEALFGPFVKTSTGTAPVEVCILSKKADFLSGLGGGAASKVLGNLSVPGSKPTPELVQDYEDKLTDPEHENQLRAIRAKAMLTDLMANDEVLSGYAPGEILGAYNHIAQLSPRASTQPAVMRPLLRKWLSQGSIEPFEAAEMANIEKTLYQSEGSPPGDKKDKI